MVLLDMKMPNGCGDCNLRDFGDGHCDVYCCPEQFKINEEDKTRPEYCPIKREIVMCKDCKHRPAEPEGGADHGSDYIFPDSVCPCQCDGDPWYSWMPHDNWFCPKGELR